VGAALTIFGMWPVVMSWQVTVPMTGAANRSHIRRWVCACLRDHRSSTGRRFKLDVHSRAEAVESARVLGLLASSARSPAPA